MNNNDNNSEKDSPNSTIKWITIDGQKQLCTLNYDVGHTVYIEKLVKVNGKEYRLWDPFRSKLAGALKKGLKITNFYDKKVLYLGASTGTTVSHVSDIIGEDGIVFAVESAPRVARELIENVALKRSNVIPILEDARKPKSYYSIFGKIDILYCDIAQQDQTEIAIQNSRLFLKDNGILYLVIKSRSIDVTKDPKQVINQEIKKLEERNFSIEQVLFLDPYDKDHGFISAINQSK